MKTKQTDLVMSDENTSYLGHFKNRKFLNDGHNTDSKKKEKGGLTKALNALGNKFGLNTSERAKKGELGLGNKQISGLGPDKRKK